MTSDAGLARLHDLLDDTDWLKSHSYDPPDDAELSITITAKERRLILAALEDREAKLTALVEALNDALSFINEAGGACLGLAMSGSNHPNPDGVQMDISRRAMTLAHTICQALAHHSAPVGPKPGEIRVVAGKRSRFIEHGDRGEVWEILPDAPPSTPTSAPVEDVAGLAWHSIETAPRDGTVFLACNLDRPSFGAWPMYRRVRHFFDGEGEAQRKDLGGWTIVGDLRPDYQEGATVGPEPDLSIAMDDVNRTIRYGWRPLSAPLPIQPAVAWRYEIATAVYPASGRATNWEWRISETKPSAPEGWIRNLTPLYARAESPALIQPQGEERS